MRRVVSLILLLTMILSLSSVTSFAQSSSENIDRIKSSYEVNEDGIVSNKDKSSDTYSKSINFLIDIGAIEVHSDGTIINNYSEEVFASKLKSEEINTFNLESKVKLNENIDYEALYEESINPNGKYYGILSEEELNNVINHVNASISENGMEIQSLEIRPLMLDFDYYQKSLQNTVLLSYTFTSYVNIGYAEPIAWYDTGLFFVNKVKTGGDWDYKTTMGKNTVYYCNMKNYYGSYTGEQIGNMHYGTVGSYLFTPTILKAAAGIYQIHSGTWQLSWLSTYFDDPSDQASIQLGINLHSEFRFPNINHLQK